MKKDDSVFSLAQCYTVFTGVSVDSFTPLTVIVVMYALSALKVKHTQIQHHGRSY